MPERDIFHDVVRNALIKDGWEITHDPLLLRIGRTKLYVDLGASTLMSAEKEQRKIAIEVKTFLSKSRIKDLEQAVGQFVIYEQILKQKEPERIVYLAVTTEVYTNVFKNELGQLLINNKIVRLLVFKLNDEVITQWII